MIVDVFKCEQCGASQLAQGDRTCAYCGACVFVQQMTQKRSFRDSQIVRANMTGQDLRFADFCDAQIVRCVFTNCDLCGADFSDAQIVKSHFENCDLRGVIREGAQFTRCTFSGCKE